jgi:hypothetical protein
MAGCLVKTIDVFVSAISPASDIAIARADGDVNSHSHASVRLDRGVKAVHEIKLVAYTIADAYRIGTPGTEDPVRDFPADDYLLLDIKEVNGEIISNNQWADGKFAVLDNVRSDVPGYENPVVHHRDMDGIVTHIFERPRTDLHTLTCAITDHRDRPRVAGRVHLWFKLRVSHG